MTVRNEPGEVLADAKEPSKYVAPLVVELGTVAELTQKSGGPTDATLGDSP